MYVDKAVTEGVNRISARLLTTKNYSSPHMVSPLSSSICHISGTPIKVSCFTLVPLLEASVLLRAQNPKDKLKEPNAALFFREKQTEDFRTFLLPSAHSEPMLTCSSGLGLSGTLVVNLPAASPLQDFGCKGSFSSGVCMLPSERGPLSHMTFVGVLLILTTDSSPYC